MVTVDPVDVEELGPEVVVLTPGPGVVVVAVDVLPVTTDVVDVDVDDAVVVLGVDVVDGVDVLVVDVEDGDVVVVDVGLVVVSAGTQPILLIDATTLLTNDVTWKKPLEIQTYDGCEANASSSACTAVGVIPTAKRLMSVVELRTEMFP